MFAVKGRKMLVLLCTFAKNVSAKIKRIYYKCSTSGRSQRCFFLLLRHRVFTADLVLRRRYELTDEEKALLHHYGVPNARIITSTSTSQVLNEPSFTRDNYKDRMHTLLYIEEMAQFSSISKCVSAAFNLYTF